VYGKLTGSNVIYIGRDEELATTPLYGVTKKQSELRTEKIV
jgi:hypothetical protein